MNENYNEIEWNKEPNSRAQVFLTPNNGIIRKIRTRTKGYKETDCFGTLLLGEIVKQASQFLPEDMSFYVPQIISTSQENIHNTWKIPFEINQFFCPGTPLNRPDSFENSQYFINGKKVPIRDKVNYLAGGIIELMQREGFAHGDAGARHFFLLPMSSQLKYLTNSVREKTFELPQGGLGIIDLEDASLNNLQKLKIDKSNFYADLNKFIGCNEYAIRGKNLIEDCLNGVSLIESAFNIAKRHYADQYGMPIPEQFKLK